MSKKTFIEIVDYIFKNKEMYKTLTDEEKTDGFFMINRKFAKQYPKVAYFLNNKSLNKPMALDFWFLFFRNVHTIPGWYWNTTTKVKEKISKIKVDDKQSFIDYTGIDDDDNIEFIYKHYREDFDNEVKKYKRFKG